MLRLVKPLAAVLVVPVICAALAIASRSQWEARWQVRMRWQAIMTHHPVPPVFLARHPLARVCSNASTASFPPCRTYNTFSSIASVSYAVGGVGLLFLVGIFAVGRACRSSLRRLARLFKPALLAAVSGLVVLVLLHGALGVAALFLLGEVIERWPVYIVLALVVATMFVAVSMIQVALAVTKKTSVSVIGRRIDLATQPRLARWLEESAAAAGARCPQQVVAGLSPALFITDATVVSLDGVSVGTTLYLSLALARILSLDECRGVLGHELSHFKPGEAELTSRFYPLYVGVRRSVAALSARARGLRSIVILPAVWILSHFTESFAVPESAVARERELAADQAGAALAGRDTYASGLVKAHAFAPAWEVVRAAMAEAVAEGTQYVNASELFSEAADANAAPERLAGVGSRALWHPTDSLPPLAVRLEALGVAPSEVAVAALLTRPATAAVTLFDGSESIERDLSEAEHRLIAVRATREGGEDDGVEAVEPPAREA